MNDASSSLENGLAGTDHERLVTAREITRNPDPALREVVQRALAVESVPWVRNALGRALSAIERGTETVRVRPTTPEVVREADLERRQIYADALHETSGMLLHEIATVVGRARLAAQSELEASSGVRRQLDLLHNLCDGLQALSDATEVPQPTDLDLAATLRSLAAEEERDSELQIRTSGPAPFIVIGDRGLLGIAVRNVIANAVEATKTLAEDRPITVSWGNDEGGYWIAVIDRGPGPPGGDPFRLGQTTKRDHRGLGLTAAQQAMQSLGGDITLEQNESDGATAVLRWPTPEAVE